MYLLHYLIAYVGMDLAAVFQWKLRFWVLACATLALSAAYWQLLQQPLAQLRRRWLNPQAGEARGS
jgi:peptidoglycan/LPS O-acetylase OafA/YrhL